MSMFKRKVVEKDPQFLALSESYDKLHSSQNPEERFQNLLSLVRLFSPIISNSPSNGELIPSFFDLLNCFLKDLFDEKKRFMSDQSSYDEYIAFLNLLINIKNPNFEKLTNLSLILLYFISIPTKANTTEVINMMINFIKNKNWHNLIINDQLLRQLSINFCDSTLIPINKQIIRTISENNYLKDYPNTEVSSLMSFFAKITNSIPIELRPNFSHLLCSIVDIDENYFYIFEQSNGLKMLRDMFIRDEKTIADFFELFMNKKFLNFLYMLILNKNDFATLNHKVANKNYFQRMTSNISNHINSNESESEDEYKFDMEIKLRFLKTMAGDVPLMESFDLTIEQIIELGQEEHHQNNDEYLNVYLEMLISIRGVFWKDSLNVNIIDQFIFETFWNLDSGLNYLANIPVVSFVPYSFNLFNKFLSFYKNDFDALFERMIKNESLVILFSRLFTVENIKEYEKNENAITTNGKSDLHSAEKGLNELVSFWLKIIYDIFETKRKLFKSSIRLILKNGYESFIFVLKHSPTEEIFNAVVIYSLDHCSEKYDKNIYGLFLIACLNFNKSLLKKENILKMIDIFSRPSKVSANSNNYTNMNKEILLAIIFDSNVLNNEEAAMEASSYFTRKNTFLNFGDYATCLNRIIFHALIKYKNSNLNDKVISNLLTYFSPTKSSFALYLSIIPNSVYFNEMLVANIVHNLSNNSQEPCFEYFSGLNVLPIKTVKTILFSESCDLIKTLVDPSIVSAVLRFWPVLFEFPLDPSCSDSEEDNESSKDKENTEDKENTGSNENDDSKKNIDNNEHNSNNNENNENERNNNTENNENNEKEKPKKKKKNGGKYERISYFWKNAIKYEKETFGTIMSIFVSAMATKQFADEEEYENLIIFYTERVIEKVQKDFSNLINFTQKEKFVFDKIEDLINIKKFIRSEKVKSIRIKAKKLEEENGKNWKKVQMQMGFWFSLLFAGTNYVDHFKAIPFDPNLNLLNYQANNENSAENINSNIAENNIENINESINENNENGNFENKNEKEGGEFAVIDNNDSENIREINVNNESNDVSNESVDEFDNREIKNYEKKIIEKPFKMQINCLWPFNKFKYGLLEKTSSTSPDGYHFSSLYLDQTIQSNNDEIFNRSDEVEIDLTNWKTYIKTLSSICKDENYRKCIAESYIIEVFTQILINHKGYHLRVDSNLLKSIFLGNPYESFEQIQTVLLRFSTLYLRDCQKMKEFNEAIVNFLIDRAVEGWFGWKSGVVLNDIFLCFKKFNQKMSENLRLAVKLGFLRIPVKQAHIYMRMIDCDDEYNDNLFYHNYCKNDYLFYSKQIHRFIDEYLLSNPSANENVNNHTGINRKTNIKISTKKDDKNNKKVNKRGKNDKDNSEEEEEEEIEENFLSTCRNKIEILKQKYVELVLEKDPSYNEIEEIDLDDLEFEDEEEFMGEMREKLADYIKKLTKFRNESLQLFDKITIEDIIDFVYQQKEDSKIESENFAKIWEISRNFDENLFARKIELEFGEFLKGKFDFSKKLNNSKLENQKKIFRMVEILNNVYDTSKNKVEMKLNGIDGIGIFTKFKFLFVEDLAKSGCFVKHVGGVGEENKQKADSDQKTDLFIKNKFKRFEGHLMYSIEKKNIKEIKKIKNKKGCLTFKDGDFVVTIEKKEGEEGDLVNLLSK